MSLDLAATPEATSLLGAPLHPMILDSAAEAELHARIDSAEAVYEARPDDADAIVWLGRRLAYAGHYHEAIDVYTEGIRKHPDEPRFYRHRGHRWITVRELDRAIEDLEHAARLTSGTEDAIEPDGMPNDAGVPRSTLQTNIWYHLGLARYLQHDFEGAAYAFRRGWEISPNDDMRVAMADWLLGGDLAHAGALDLATHGYGLGAWRLVRGDRPGARAAFERVLETGYWPAFGYIAAEAELRAMRDREEPEPEPSSRRMQEPGN